MGTSYPRACLLTAYETPVVYLIVNKSDTRTFPSLIVSISSDELRLLAAHCSNANMKFFQR